LYLLPSVTAVTNVSYCYTQASLKQCEGERGTSEVMFTELLKRTGEWQLNRKYAVGVLGRRVDISPQGT